VQGNASFYAPYLSLLELPHLPAFFSPRALDEMQAR
jgi:hypothetical protein